MAMSPEELLKEQLRKMAEGYVARLQEKIGAVEATWRDAAARLAGLPSGTPLVQGDEGQPPTPGSAEEALRSMRNQAHKLSGSGATFGFPAISNAARALELILDGILERAALPTADDGAEIERLLAGLAEAARDASGCQSAGKLEGDLPGRQSAPAAPAPAAGRPSGRRPVFLIDDDLDTAQILALQLGAYGYDVRIFTELSGIEEIIARSDPAAILMDISFPESALAGTDTVAEIQRGRAEPVPVIFVSARTDLDTRLQAVRAGGHGYFAKPVDVARLAEKLEVLIAHPAADLDAVRIVFEREVAAMPRKILGEVCVEKGWVSAGQLDEVASQPGDARAVADALVARGWITPTQKQEALAVVFERQMGARRKGAFGEICVEKKWITAEQLAQARSRQAVRAGQGAASVLDVLVRDGAITPQQRAEAQGIAWGIPFVDLATMLLNPEVTRGLLSSIDGETCRQLKVVPFQRTRWRVRVAMQNPLDVFAQDQISALIGKGVAIELAIAAEEDILQVLEQSTRGAQGTLAPMLDQILVDAGQQPEISVSHDDGAEEIVDTEVLRDMSGHAPVIALCNGIILRGVQEGASDIHLQPRKDGMVMRLRVDGVLRDALRIPRDLQPAVTSRFKLMAELDIANRLIPQDGRVGVVIRGKPYDLRVSSLPCVWGEEIVMRILDKSAAQVGLEKLGMLPETRERFEQIISASYGLILITGPTGSGKTTTLYSVLNRLNVREKKIVTVEDPVEYQLPGLTQVQAHPAAGLTFASALKSFLRQDPDTMMVGEIRDVEVGRIAMEAALTGHLVLSTLHTNDAPTAVTRLAEMGIENFLISSTVLGVLAQRLVRRICERCKETYTPDAASLARLGLSPVTDAPFYRGRGCDACGGSGYRGRQGVYELLSMSDELRQAVNDGISANEVRDLARRQGMTLLQEDAKLKIKLGLTTVDEAIRVLATA